VFLDPVEVNATSIPLYQSGGYIAVSGLAAGASTLLTIEVPDGFPDGVNGSREVWAMVDSLEQIAEADETNNIGGPTMVTGIVTATVGTPTPVPAGVKEISGITRVLLSGNKLVPQPRARLFLQDGSGQLVSTTSSGINGNYRFLNVEDGSYRVWSCINIDGTEYSGSIANIVPTNTLADIQMLVGFCPY